MINTKIKTFIVSLSLLTAASFSGQAFASDCKGLKTELCASNAACSWVGGYERKDGRQVKAFCRAKPNFKGKDKVVSKAKAAPKAASKSKSLTAGR